MIDLHQCWMVADDLIKRGRIKSFSVDYFTYQRPDFRTSAMAMENIVSDKDGTVTIERWYLSPVYTGFQDRDFSAVMDRLKTL